MLDRHLETAMIIFGTTADETTPDMKKKAMAVNFGIAYGNPQKLMPDSTISNTTITAYKIVELKKGKLKTLFHGINRSKTIKQGEWIEAEVKLGRDGSGERWYLTGWHTLLTLEETQEYLKNFSEDKRERLKIVKCEIKDTWLKEHSNANVILSRWIKFGDIVG